MEKGYNSDLNFEGRSYHVQTEDWGTHNPFIVSRIFLNGAVIKTIKTPYSFLKNQDSATHSEVLKEALKNQHHIVIEQLLGGERSTAFDDFV